MKSRAMILGAIGCLALGAAAGQAKSTKTVFVDCAKGESIAQALEEKAEELIVEIRGICEEEVQVRRSNVTLRGADPELDGIRPGADEPLDPALNLFGVHLVVTENLQISEGRVGLGLNSSFGIDIVNCRIRDNDTVGFILGTASGSVDLIDSEVTGNGGTGIWVANGSALRCFNCRVEDNGAFRRGIQVTNGSELTLTDSLVEAFRAVDLAGGSRLTGGAVTTITGLPWVLRTQGTVSVQLSGAALDGRLDLREGSTVELFGVTLANPAPAGWLTGGSTLILKGGSALGGDLDLSELSQAVFQSGSGLAGNLTCSLGADAFCEDPVASIGGVSDCARCPNPERVTDSARGAGRAAPGTAPAGEVLRSTADTSSAPGVSTRRRLLRNTRVPWSSSPPTSAPTSTPWPRA